MRTTIQPSIKRLFSILAAGAIALAAFTGPAVQAADGTGQNIVVSVQKNMYNEAGYESACIAVSIATLLQSNGASVTLFGTLDGVGIANDLTLSYVDAYAIWVGDYRCVTSSGEKLLTELVTGFVNAGGSIMACPICWNTRYGTEAADQLTAGAQIGTTATLADLSFGADKVLDF